MNKPMVIGVNGGSGSGKSSFVESLSKLFTDLEMTVVSMDNYYFPREQQLEDSNGKRNFDLPESLDVALYEKHIKQLIAGSQVEKTEYTFNNPNKSAAALVFKPAPIILLEGLFLFHYTEIQTLMDYKIFIEASDDLKIIRRIKRDGIERNYPLDDVLYRYDAHVSPSYRKYILPYKNDADIIVNNFSDFDKGIEILSGFIKQELNNIG